MAHIRHYLLTDWNRLTKNDIVYVESFNEHSQENFHTRGNVLSLLYLRHSATRILGLFVCCPLSIVMWLGSCYWSWIASKCEI